MSEQKIRAVHVATDEGGDQGLYVDGVLVDQDNTIYACDIEAAVNGDPCTIITSNVELPPHVRDWPRTLAELEEQSVASN